MSKQILIAKRNKNVFSNNLDDFLLASPFSLLKVHDFKHFTITPPSVLYTVSHNLGYKPFAMVFSQFVNDDGSVTDEYYQQNWDILLGSEIFGYHDIKNNTIEIRIGGPVDAVRPVQGFYYIFKEQLQL